MTALLSAYAGLGRLAAPMIAMHLRRRQARGKEHPDRLPERFGTPSKPRPEAPLIWLHAASVGESLSALPLIEALQGRHPNTEFLLTTGTATSAALLSHRASHVLHQFAPVDTPRAVGQFLDHWRPDLGIWIESELWPNLVLDAHRRKIPLALVNARMSEKSARGWGYAPRSAAQLLNAFGLRLCQTNEVAARLADLGADPQRTLVTGDLKASRPVEAPDADALARMRDAIGERPVLLSASTHPGDEEVALAAHQHLAKRLPRLLSIIAPRHPSRGPAIARMAMSAGYQAVLRSDGNEPSGEIYIGDTLGELALWYALAPIALIGGGWDGVGGHNPMEAAQQGCLAVSGPDVAAFRPAYEALSEIGAATLVTRSEAPEAICAAFDADGSLTAQSIAARRAAIPASAPDLRPLNRSIHALGPLLDGALR